MQKQKCLLLLKRRNQNKVDIKAIKVLLVVLKSKAVNVLAVHRKYSVKLVLQDLVLLAN